MSEVKSASVSILELCGKHDIDPFAIVGLLALGALDRLDLAAITFWKKVSENLMAAKTA